MTQAQNAFCLLFSLFVVCLDSWLHHILFIFHLIIPISTSMLQSDSIIILILLSWTLKMDPWMPCPHSSLEEKPASQWCLILLNNLLACTRLNGQLLAPRMIPEPCQKPHLFL